MWPCSRAVCALFPINGSIIITKEQAEETSNPPLIRDSLPKNLVWHWDPGDSKFRLLNIRILFHCVANYEFLALLLRGSNGLEAQMHSRPIKSVCRVGQFQEVNLSCLFHWMSVSWQWLVHWLVHAVNLQPIPWSSLLVGAPSDVCCSSVANWNTHATNSVDEIYPWKFMEHMFLIVQGHDSELASSYLPVKLYHIGYLGYNTWEWSYDLLGHYIRILPGQFWCLWYLKQDNADSCYSKHVKLFHDSKQWFSELCAYTITVALALGHSCFATTVVHLFSHRLLMEGPCRLIAARASLCATLKTAVMFVLHTTSSYDGKYLLVHAALRSFWCKLFPTTEAWSCWQGECYNQLPSCEGPTVCQLLICNEFSETTSATTKSEVIQAHLSSPSSGIIVNGLCNLRAMWCQDHVLLRTKKWLSNIRWSQLGIANFEASFWPEQHIIGNYVQVLVTAGSQLQLFSDSSETVFLMEKFPELADQLKGKWEAPWLGHTLVQTTINHNGAFRYCWERSDQHKLGQKSWSSWVMSSTIPLEMWCFCDDILPCGESFSWKRTLLVKFSSLLGSVITSVDMHMVNNTCMMLRNVELCSASHFDVAYGREIVLCNIMMHSTIDILVSQLCCEGILPVYWGQGLLGALVKLEDLSCNLLLFSFSDIVNLQGHWYLGLIHNLSIPPCLNWQRYLHAHWWVVQAQQTTSQGMIKKFSTWYWYRQTSTEPEHQLIGDKVKQISKGDLSIEFIIFMTNMLTQAPRKFLACKLAKTITADLILTAGRIRILRDSCFSKTSSQVFLQLQQQADYATTRIKQAMHMEITRRGFQGHWAYNLGNEHNIHTSVRDSWGLLKIYVGKNVALKIVGELSLPWNPGVAGIVYEDIHGEINHHFGQQVLLAIPCNSLSDGVEFYMDYGQAPFQGGRSITVLVTFVDNHYYLNAFLDKIHFVHAFDFQDQV